MQIINDSIFDVLADESTATPLQIRTDKHVGMYVAGLSEYTVTNPIDVFSLIKRASKTHAQNPRCHKIVTLCFERKRDNEKYKFSICDLAGSERLGYDGSLSRKEL